MHSCSNPNCSHTAPRSTKYHTCPLCKSKLIYTCNNCKGSFFSSNSKHKKKCTKMISTTEAKEVKSVFLYGKKKIILKRNDIKICVAFFANGQFNYGRTRKKFGNQQAKTKIQRKDKVKHLQLVNNVPSSSHLIKFSTIINRYSFNHFFNHFCNINIKKRISIKSKLSKQVQKYYNYVTEFSPKIIRRERPICKETALSHLKRLYYIFGFIEKYLKKERDSLELCLVLCEDTIRKFFSQV